MESKIQINKTTVLSWASQLVQRQLSDWDSVNEKVLLAIILVIFPNHPPQSSLLSSLQYLNIPVDILDIPQILAGKKRHIYAILVIFMYLYLIQQNNTSAVEFSLQIDPPIVQFLESPQAVQVAKQNRMFPRNNQQQSNSKLSSPQQKQQHQIESSERSLKVDELINQIDQNINNQRVSSAARSVSPTGNQKSLLRIQQEPEILGPKVNLTEPSGTLRQSQQKPQKVISPQQPISSELVFKSQIVKPKLLSSQAFVKQQNGFDKSIQTVTTVSNDSSKQRTDNSIDKELLQFFSNQVDGLVKQIQKQDQFIKFDPYQGNLQQDIVIQQIAQIAKSFDISGSIIKQLISSFKNNQTDDCIKLLNNFTEYIDQIQKQKIDFQHILETQQKNQIDEQRQQIEMLQEQLSFYKNLVEQQELLERQDGIFRVIPKYILQLDQNTKANETLYFQINLLKQSQQITDEINKKLSLNPIVCMPDDSDIMIINPEIMQVIQELEEKYDSKQSAIFDEDFLSYFTFEVQQSLRQYNQNVSSDAQLFEAEEVKQIPELPHIFIKINQYRNYIRELVAFVSKISVFYEQQHVNDKHEFRNAKQQLLQIQKQILDYQENVKADFLQQQLEYEAKIQQSDHQVKYLQSEMVEVTRENQQALQNNFELQQTTQKYKLQHMQLSKKNLNYEKIIEQQSEIMDRLRIKLDVGAEVKKLEQLKQNSMFSEVNYEQIEEPGSVSMLLVSQLKEQKDQLFMQLNELFVQQKVTEKQYEQLELLYKEQRAFIEQFHWIEEE